VSLAARREGLRKPVENFALSAKQLQLVIRLGTIDTTRITDPAARQRMEVWQGEAA
jgi:hypothetical protein